MDFVIESIRVGIITIQLFVALYMAISKVPTSYIIVVCTAAIITTMMVM